jgi:hypothetical protein
LGFPPPLVVEALGPHGGYSARLMSPFSMMCARSFSLNSGFFQLKER